MYSGDGEGQGDLREVFVPPPTPHYAGELEAKGEFTASEAVIWKDQTLR